MLFNHFSFTMRRGKERGKDSISESQLQLSINRCFFRQLSDSSQDKQVGAETVCQIKIVMLRNKWVNCATVYVLFCLWACARLCLGHYGIKGTQLPLYWCLNWVDCCNEDYKAKSWLWLGSNIWLGQANLTKVQYRLLHTLLSSLSGTHRRECNCPYGCFKYPKPSSCNHLILPDSHMDWNEILLSCWVEFSHWFSFHWLKSKTWSQNLETYIILHWYICCEKEHSDNSQLFVPQVSEALQGDEDKGVAELVPANLEGPALPPHQGSSHHSPGP